MAHYSTILFVAFLLIVPFQETLAQLQNPRNIPYNWQTDTDLPPKNRTIVK